MNDPLSVIKVKEQIKKAEESFRHEECNSCECFLGYLAQLEIDADTEGKEVLKSYRSEREPIHSCLGCDPCPPGVLYAEYLRKKTVGTI
jgi:hypothetical protein